MSVDGLKIKDLLDDTNNNDVDEKSRYVEELDGLVSVSANEPNQTSERTSDQHSEAAPTIAAFRCFIVFFYLSYRGGHQGRGMVLSHRETD